MTDKKYNSIVEHTLDFKDICTDEELTIVFGNLLAAQDWADRHPNNGETQIVNNIKYY